MAAPRISDEAIAAGDRMIEEITVRNAQKEAAKKARWDFYNEQLAKSTPFQGGVPRSNLIIRARKIC